jgi:uncharacterized membrane protein YphA (DoxX/SURF4 family)
LLLLRTVPAIAALWHGGMYLSGRENPTNFDRISGLLLCLVGSSLLLGFLTPLCAALIFLGGAVLIFLSFQRGDLGLSAFCITVISAAVILLGPGAFSIDARLFGRREIIIPDRDQKLEGNYEASKDNKKE